VASGSRVPPSEASLTVAAQAFVDGLKVQSGFLAVALQLVSSSAPMDVRLAAATVVKNVVKESWERKEDKPYVIADADKAVAKNVLPALAVSQPRALSRVLIAAIAAIADCDFPSKWDNLLRVSPPHPPPHAGGPCRGAVAVEPPADMHRPQHHALHF
jgi:hypothetical protein